MKRLFIIDHGCVLPYGHAVSSMKIFADALSHGFKTVECLGSKVLRGKLNGGAIHCILNNPYDGYIVDNSAVPIDLDWKKGRRVGFKLRRKTNWVSRRRRRSTVGQIFDLTMSETSSNFLKVMHKFQINSQDTILFHNAEYYGSVAILRALQRSKVFPMLHFRFIGVLEGASYMKGGNRSVVIEEINKYPAEKRKVYAETPAYSDYLSKVVKGGATYFPYPFSANQTSVAWGEKKNISSPGQGRLDKGFHLWPKIIFELSDRGLKDEFMYTLQSMSVMDQYYDVRLHNMYSKHPEVVLHDPIVGTEVIQEMYRSSDILAMPYDSDTYAYRGSAVFQEGMSHGRPFVATSGTAFGEQIERYNIGLVCSNVADIADNILELSQYSRLEVQTMVDRARKLYDADVNLALASIIGEA